MALSATTCEWCAWFGLDDIQARTHLRTRVKICGITNEADARLAVDAGADALGFVFYEKSPRRLGLEEAKRIIDGLPPFVSKVGVFVNATLEQIRGTVFGCGLDTGQLHGEETPEFAAAISFAKCYKAFRVQDEGALTQLAAFGTCAWLLDSYVPGQMGGTGERFNWDIAKAAIELGRPVILAGGLTHENVCRAVRQVRPYGVDVSSGVEASPGRKDPHKVRRFVEEAIKDWATV